MIQPALQPAKLWETIADLHYKLITPFEARILALIEEGYDNDEIAALVQREPGTVRRHVADLCHRVFDGSDIPATREKLRTGIAHARRLLHPACARNDRKGSKNRIGSE